MAGYAWPTLKQADQKFPEGYYLETHTLTLKHLAAEEGV